MAQAIVFFNHTKLYTGCDSPSKDNLCCSASNLCGDGQGHCKNDTGCIAGLKCEFCDRELLYPKGTKCCKLLNNEISIGADKLFLGQGDCTDDWECYGSLICGRNDDTRKDCKKIVPDGTRCCKEGMYYYQDI